MRSLVALIWCLGTVVPAFGASILDGTLDKAGESQGAEYVRLRDDILRRGSVLLPDLKQASVDSKLTWRQRLVARIWTEWMERRSEIESLRKYAWDKDPDFNREMLQNHIGPWVGMVPLMTKRLKERRLWYYYCEAAVLKSDERWVVPSGYDWLPKYWGGMAWQSLAGEPEFYYSIAWMRETLRRDLDLRTEDARKARHTLEVTQISDAVPELLASYLASRRVVKERFGQDRGRSNRLFDLIKLAGSQHAALFDEFVAAHIEFSGLKPRIDQLRTQPPVKEWEEPTYNPGHESELLKAAPSKP